MDPALDEQEQLRLAKELTDEARPNEGIEELDLAIKDIDDESIKLDFAISTNPDMSDRLKTFCMEMQGISYHFQVARAYLDHDRKTQAREELSEAETCLEKGKESCRIGFDGTFGEDLVYVMDRYHRSLLQDISQRMG